MNTFTSSSGMVAKDSSAIGRSLCIVRRATARAVAALPCSWAAALARESIVSIRSTRARCTGVGSSEPGSITSPQSPSSAPSL